MNCLKRPLWGVLTDSEATACLSHKDDIFGGPVINFTLLCKVTGCKSVSRWGIEGKQPTYCGNHGPLTDGLVCTVGRTRSKRSRRNPLYDALKGPPFNGKTECFF